MDAPGGGDQGADGGRTLGEDELVRLVVLHTSYRIADIYDYDHGLTAKQLTYLAAGVVEDGTAQFARGLQILAAGGGLFANAMGAGFSGKTEGLVAAMTGLNEFAAKLLQQDTGTGEGVQTGEVMEVPPEAGSHPLFTVNLGRSLV